MYAGCYVGIYGFPIRVYCIRGRSMSLDVLRRIVCIQALDGLHDDFYYMSSRSVVYGRKLGIYGHIPFR